MSSSSRFGGSGGGGGGGGDRQTNIIRLFDACLMYKGGDSMEIKTEADNDITECSQSSHDDDKPSTGMFAVSDDIVSAVSCLCILCAVCCLRCFDCNCNHVITCCVAKIKVY